MSKGERSKGKGDFEIVVPTRVGKDLQDKDGTTDAHIRIERYKETGANIYIDSFVSAAKDADYAHITSELFPWSDEGASEATKLLQENGFRSIVTIK